MCCRGPTRLLPTLTDFPDILDPVQMDHSFRNDNIAIYQ
jgi:hypothetical protein